MSFSKILEKLFKNSGAGPSLSDNVTAELVHKTGEETVEGIKTFTGILPNSLGRGIIIRNPEITRGTTPSDYKYSSIVFADSANNEYDTTDSGNHGRIGVVETVLSDTGLPTLQLAAYKNELNDNTTARLQLTFSSTDAPHVNVLNTYFNVIQGDNAIRIRDPRVVKGTTPSTVQYSYVEFYDSNSARLGWVGHSYWTDGSNSMRLCVRRADSFSLNDEANLSIGFDANGDPFTYVPTPANTSNDNNIATTAFVKNQHYATTDTEQTISGDKTYTGSIYHKNTSFYVYKTNLTYGTAPSSEISGSLYVQDKDKNDIGWFYCGVDSSGGTFARFSIKDFKSTSTTAITVGLSRPYNSTSSYEFRPYSDNNITLGLAARRWKQVFAGTSTISTSDERMKMEIEKIPDEVLDVWGNVDFFQFKMKDSFEEKGESARIHSGLVAQRINNVFSSAGLDISKYGLFCYDEWSAIPESFDENGNKISDMEPAGNRYSLRYEEALCMEAAYMRRKVAHLEARIAELEKSNFAA